MTADRCFSIFWLLRRDDEDLIHPSTRPRHAQPSAKPWCGQPDSNRHSPFGPRDFKSLASTNFAMPAQVGFAGVWEPGSIGVLLHHHP